nr:TetR/AcrR family transcriptional regulator [Mycobacterium parascrofulaceum]
MRENGHARRARLTADRILEAAVAAFAQEGYRAATIEDIAARAGVAPSSVYNHFTSKAGIAQALAERALEVHGQYVAAAWSLDVSPLQRLIAAAGATLAFAGDRPALFEAISLSYLGPLGLFPADTAAAEAIATRRHEQLQRIVAVLDEAISAGELQSMDTVATARFLLAAWAGVLTMEAGSGDQARAASTLAAGIRALIQGMGTATTLTREHRLTAVYHEALSRYVLSAATGQPASGPTAALTGPGPVSATPRRRR